MLCCNDGSADLARILLQNGADTKIKNSTGTYVTLYLFIRRENTVFCLVIMETKQTNIETYFLKIANFYG